MASEPTALAASRAARRQHSRVEIASDRTAYSQTFANPNGTTTYQVSRAPRWVKRGSAWVPVDATLLRGKDGSWSPEAAEGGLSFSGGGNRALATVRSGGQWLSLSWPWRLPAPKVSGATATYSLFPGADLVLTAQVTGGFDETLVLRDRAAAADPRLRNLTLGVSASRGLSPHAGRGGSVVVETAKGKPVFFSPGPRAWRSTAPGTGVAGPGRHPRA